MARQLHVLFAIRSVRHISYLETLMEAFLRRGHQLTLRFDQRWSKVDRLDVPHKKTEHLHEFRARWPDVAIAFSQRRPPRSRRLVHALRELRSYAAYLRRLGPDDYYSARWAGYLEPPVRALADSRPGRALLRLPALGRLLAAAEGAVPPTGSVLRELRHLEPDVVVAAPANMRFGEEIEYVKAARRLGIPTAIQAYSWDNLTTKGLYHVAPDLLLAWNEAHAAAAREVHGIPSERIAITGAPFFDKWLRDTADVEPRTDFLERIGLDPGAEYVLYLGSSKNIAPDETGVVGGLVDALAASRDERLRGAHVLVRPHPANSRPWQELRAPRTLVWPPKGVLPEAADEVGEFVTVLRHAIAAVGINTSGMIDAVALDAPTFALLVDEFERTQSRAEHFRVMADSGAMAVAESPERLVERLEALLAGADPEGDARRRFVARYLRPAGRAAGEAGAELVERLALDRGR